MELASSAWRRRAGQIAVTCALATVVVVNHSALVGVVALFVLVVPFEKLFPRHPQSLRRPGLGTDLAYGIGQPVLRVVTLVAGLPIAILSLAWLPGLLLRPVVGALPLGARAVFGVVLFDFIAYWGHRWSHEVPFLWRFHAVHHSSERMDWLSGVRVHPFDGAVIAPALVGLLAAGFSPRTTGAIAIVQVVSGLFLHANVRWRLRPLQRVVATPEFHHWHHSSEADALNTNFAAFLPVWDVVFGTAFLPADRRPAVYGTTTPVPAGLVPQLVEPMHGLTNPLVAMRHPVTASRQLRAALRRGAAQVVAATRR